MHSIKLRSRVCDECGSGNILSDAESGELVCTECGYVITEKYVDPGQEWRSFDREQFEQRSRVGAPITWAIHDMGISTMIDSRDRDAAGRELSPTRRAQLYRLRKWHRRSKVSGTTERNLSYALSEMTKTYYRLNLPANVLETASILYRKAIQKRIVKGRSIHVVAAASVYMASRQCRIIRSIEEVAKNANVGSKELGRAYRVMLRYLGNDVPRIEPESYLSKFVSQLSLNGETELLARDILKIASYMRLTIGRGPSGIAAASLYIACLLNGELQTQGNIAKIADVTEVTIRNRYKELMQALNIQINL
jgi:transcription initiation factor TFIIB